MAVVRKGFDVPYGAVTASEGNPTQSMVEYMDQVTRALTQIKTAADNMVTATGGDVNAPLWNQLKTDLQGIE